MTARKMDVPFLYMYILTTWYLGSAFRGFLSLSLHKQAIFKKSVTISLFFYNFLFVDWPIAKSIKSKEITSHKKAKTKQKPME